jgi:hypothetical protein
MNCAVVKALNSSGDGTGTNFSNTGTCTEYEDVLNVTSCSDVT